MVIFVWLMEMTQEEEWKCALVVYGVWYVMTSGILMMLELSAEDWDCQQNVSDVFHGKTLILNPL